MRFEKQKREGREVRILTRADYRRLFAANQRDYTRRRVRSAGARANVFTRPCSGSAF